MPETGIRARKNARRRFDRRGAGQVVLVTPLSSGAGVELVVPALLPPLAEHAAIVESRGQAATTPTAWKGPPSP